MRIANVNKNIKMQ